MKTKIKEIILGNKFYLVSAALFGGALVYHLSGIVLTWVFSHILLSALFLALLGLMKAQLQNKDSFLRNMDTHLDRLRLALDPVWVPIALVSPIIALCVFALVNPNEKKSDPAVVLISESDPYLVKSVEYKDGKTIIHVSESFFVVDLISVKIGAAAKVQVWKKGDALGRALSLDCWVRPRYLINESCDVK